MKTFRTVIVFGFTIFCWTTSYGQNWLWAVSSGGTGGYQSYQEGWSVAVDDSGNVYAEGWFYTSTITFGNFTLLNDSTGGGTSDIYLVKYNSMGDVMWAQSFGGKKTDYSYNVAVDHSGNVYLAGSFYSDTISFGSVSLINTSSQNDVFLTKLNSTGVTVWAKAGAGNGFDDESGLAIDQSGNIYVTGTFWYFPISFPPYTLNNPFDVEIFLVKYDPSGNVIWVTSASNNLYSSGIAADAFGNVYMTGAFFADSVKFGSHVLYNDGINMYDIFLAKYDASGNVLWATNPIGSDDANNEGDRGYYVTTDGLGNAYITGYIGSTSINFGGTTLINAQGTDAFLAKYDPSGNVLWAKNTEGDMYEFGGYLTCDAYNNVYMTGRISSHTMTFEGYTFYNPNGSVDPLFIIALNPNGDVVCTTSLLSGGDDQCAIATDKHGNAYLVGDFYNTDPFVIGVDSLHQTCMENVFVAKFTCNLDGVQELNMSQSKIYPNPFSTITQITFPYQQKISSIKLFDEYGRKVYFTSQSSQQGNKTQLTIERGNLASGMYFLSITSNEKREVVKLMIE